MNTSKMNILGTLAITAGLAVGAAWLVPAVFAQSSSVAASSTQAGWLTIPQLHDRLEAAGYTAIDDIESEKDGYEVKATDREGRRVELDVHPVTGEVLKTETKSDKSRDDSRNQRADWLTIPQLYGKLEAAGYTGIDEIEREKNGYEVKAIDRDGRRVELDVHPVTGEVLETEVKNDKRSDAGRSQQSLVAPKALS